MVVSVHALHPLCIQEDMLVVYSPAGGGRCSIGGHKIFDLYPNWHM